MKIYEIKFKALFESDKYLYIMAEDFDEAVKIAEELRKKRAEKEGDATIEAISEQFEITKVA